MSQRLPRLAACCGLGLFAALAANLAFTRAAPRPDHTAAQIVTELAAHHDSYVLSGYLIGLQAFFLLVVSAGLASLIAGWLARLALAGGVAAAVLTAASSAALYGATFTAGRQITPDAIWGSYEAHTWLLVGSSMPAALLFGAVAIGAQLPRWLRLWAAVVAVGYLIGGLYPFGTELDGGIGGAAWFLALILGYVWVAVVSARSLLPRRGGRPTPGD